MIAYRLAVQWLERHSPALPAEIVAITAAAGRVLAADLTLPQAPSMACAGITGIAVLAAQTAGATDYTPLPCPGIPVRAGSPMPAGTDAVISAHAHDGATVTAPVARGEFVMQPGHDVAAGQILPAGTRLTALHLAMLDTAPAVFQQPVLGGQPGPMIQALALQAGARLHGTPNLLINPSPEFSPDLTGLAIRPGETTALGTIEGLPAIRLPTAAADTATAFTLLVAPMLRRMAGLPEPPALPARLSRKIASALGMLEAVRVRLEAGVATPLGPSEGLPLWTAATADGLVLVPEGSEGYAAGAMVSVIPL